MNAIALRASATGIGFYRDLSLCATSAPSRGSYSPSHQDYVDIFYSSLRKWESETFHVSSIPEIVEHPAFLNIVEMGELAIPLIVQELENKPSVLLFALNKIVGAAPYLDADRGNIKAMTNAWLAWARRKGF